MKLHSVGQVLHYILKRISGIVYHFIKLSKLTQAPTVAWGWRVWEATRINVKVYVDIVYHCSITFN